MYSAKSGNRRSSRSYGGYMRSSSPRYEKKSRGNSYSRENNNTSWEYGFNDRGSGSSNANRAPDPSMCMNHAMEFVNLDNYIANMFG